MNFWDVGLGYGEQQGLFTRIGASTLRLGSTEIDLSVENVFESRAHTQLLSSLHLCVSFFPIIAIRLTLLMPYYSVELDNHNGPQVHHLCPASTPILGIRAEAMCFSAPVNSSVFCNPPFFFASGYCFLSRERWFGRNIYSNSSDFEEVSMYSYSR